MCKETLKNQPQVFRQEFSTDWNLSSKQNNIFSAQKKKKPF